MVNAEIADDGVSPKFEAKGGDKTTESPDDIFNPSFEEVDAVCRYLQASGSPLHPRHVRWALLAGWYVRHGFPDLAEKWIKEASH